MILSGGESEKEKETYVKIGFISCTLHEIILDRSNQRRSDGRIRLFYLRTEAEFSLRNMALNKTGRRIISRKSIIVLNPTICIGHLRKNATIGIQLKGIQ
jgi:hypothetical protein